MLWRCIRDNHFWQDKPFDRGRAWIDLLMLANHKDGVIRSRGISVDVKRGQVGWSEIALAEKWGWSRGKVRRFLKDLLTKQQIEQQNNNVTSLITIVKYDMYQSGSTSDGTTDDTANGQQTDNKQYPKKNDNNEKKEHKKIFCPPTQKEVIEYCRARNKKVDPEKWYNFYASKGWMVGKNKMKDWQAAVRTWEQPEVKTQRIQNADGDYIEVPL